MLNNKRLLFQGEINSLLNQKKLSYLIYTDQPERGMEICKEHLIPVNRISDRTFVIEIEQDGSFDSFKNLMQQNNIQIIFADKCQEKIGVCIPSSNKIRLMKPVSFFTILKSDTIN